jgi:hypothetical protein
MDRLLSIQAFVRVAEAESFAEAARQLGGANSVVTQRIKQLEEFIDTPLFHRSTRSVKLSEIGAEYYKECAELVAVLMASQIRCVRSRARQLARSGSPGSFPRSNADVCCCSRKRTSRERRLRANCGRWLVFRPFQVVLTCQLQHRRRVIWR